MALANRVFEYCFDPKTNLHFQQFLFNQAARPTVHFLFSILWNFLVGDGWKDWNKACIDQIKQRADRGDEIVYLAGGSDIFALISSGIYNIRIIDPFLPTQARYYSDGWDFLIRGAQSVGIDDEIRFGGLHNNVFMKRTTYAEGESFSIKLSNNTIADIKKSVTTWQVCDVNNNILGAVTFERRLVHQNDFIPQPNRTLLISYNELTYAAIPASITGWDIDVAALPNNFEIMVKQLRRPVAKDMVCALRLTSLVNFTDNKFIGFGSDPQ
jgi:hypothetical protein